MGSGLALIICILFGTMTGAILLAIGYVKSNIPMLIASLITLIITLMISATGIIFADEFIQKDQKAKAENHVVFEQHDYIDN